MRLTLQLHPESRCASVEHIEVDLARTHVVTLRYVVTGRIDRILLPAPAEPIRADGLWKHTC
ncbi:MAG: DOMON-like domain-containing protein, partial [Vitreimonas sp.]